MLKLNTRFWICSDKRDDLPLLLFRVYEENDYYIKIESTYPDGTPCLLALTPETMPKIILQPSLFPKLTVRLTPDEMHQLAIKLVKEEIELILLDPEVKKKLSDLELTQLKLQLYKKYYYKVDLENFFQVVKEATNELWNAKIS